MTALLECHDLDAGYTGTAVVRSFSLTLEPGSVVALLGPNGAGKTTVLATLAGMLEPIRGEVTAGGVRIAAGQPHRVARSGVILVPDDRALFNRLSVVEHMQLARRRGGLEISDMFDYFPGLVSRRDVPAGSLSGGEQQMLALARAIIQRPRVLLIDEMSMGLAPTIVESLMPVVRRIAHETDAAVLLVEQHVHLALECADRAVVLVHGDTVFDGSAETARQEQGNLQAAYLGG